MSDDTAPIRLDYPDGQWLILGSAHPIQVPCKKHGKERGEPCFGTLADRRWQCCGERTAANGKRMAKAADALLGLKGEKP